MIGILNGKSNATIIACFNDSYSEWLSPTPNERESHATFFFRLSLHSRGPHFGDTMEFVHYITKADFVFPTDRALTWDDFEDEPFCVLPYNDATPNANPDVTPFVAQTKFETVCTGANAVPNRTGRHVIYAEWGRRPPSSDERFHGCIDVAFPDGPTQPTPPPPTDLPTNPPPLSTAPPPTDSPPSGNVATTTRYWDCNGGT